jgi:hypothetical protein
MIYSYAATPSSWDLNAFTDSQNLYTLPHIKINNCLYFVFWSEHFNPYRISCLLSWTAHTLHFLAGYFLFPWPPTTICLQEHAYIYFQNISWGEHLMWGLFCWCWMNINTVIFWRIWFRTVLLQLAEETACTLGYLWDWGFDKPWRRLRRHSLSTTLFSLLSLLFCRVWSNIMNTEQSCPLFS